MEEIEESMLVLFNRDTKLINLISKVIDLWSPGQMADVLELLQRAADLCPMRLDLRSNVFQCWLLSRSIAIKFKLEWH